MLRLRRGNLEFQALQLLWSTWSEMCDFVDVGVKTSEDDRDWPMGVYVDHNGEVTASAYGNGRIGLRLPLGSDFAILGVEGDWIVKAPNGAMFPVPDAKLRLLFEVIGE